MQARISSDDNITFNMFSSGFEDKVIEDGAVEFSFIQDVILIDDLDKEWSTPIILADF